MTTVAARPDERTQPPVRPAQGGSKERWVRRAPLLPALIFALVITQIPFLYTLYLSTLSWNALKPGKHEFIGLENYANVLTDPRLRAALVNTVVLTAGAVLFSML